MSVEATADHQSTSTNVGRGLPSTNENRLFDRTYPSPPGGSETYHIVLAIPDTSTLIVDNDWT